MKRINIIRPNFFPRKCSILHFAAVPEGSGRFPEGYPEGDVGICCFTAVPEGSGRFPEAFPEAYFDMRFYRSSGRFPEGYPEGERTVFT